MSRARPAPAVALAALLLATLTLLLPALALAAAPRASLPDVEDEVMCTQCGTPLNVSIAPVADRERRFIQTQIDRGKTKAEIKVALEAEYGPRVLAVPSRGGFENAAYLVPIVLGLLAVLGVAGTAYYWRRNRRPDLPVADGDASDELPDADRRRLDAELAAFER